ncbi:MAG: hypothetical protein ISP90_12460 [Nevskia sp.]|nr:hypothetical protein [Nevskia sp.]
MEIIRFFETPDGGSRFEQRELPFPKTFTDEYGNDYQLGEPFDVGSAIFAELPHGLDQSWHGAPNRQLVLVLTGRLEVETTDGQIRRWGPGQVFMADDTGGKGHKTRVLEGPARLLFLRMPEGFKVDQLLR